MAGSARIWGNTSVTILSVLLPGLLGLWSLKPLLELLDVETFTLLSFFWVYTSHVGFFDLGLSRSLAIELPKLPFEERGAWVFQCVRKGLKYALLGMLVVFVAMWILPIWQPQYAFLHEPHILILLLLCIPLGVLQMIVRGALEANEAFVSAAWFRGYNQVVLFLAPWGMAYWGIRDITPIIQTITALRLLALIPVGFWLLRWLGVRVSSWMDSTAITLNQNNGWITLSNLSGIVNGSLDRFVLLSLLGTQAIGAYVFAQDFGVRILVLSSSFALVLLPFFAKNHGHQENQTWMVRGMGLIVIAHLLLALVLMFGKTWLIHRFGNVGLAIQGFRFFWIFLLGITANGMGHLLLSAVHSQRELKKPAIWHAWSALLYIPLLYGVVNAFGVVGAAWLWSMRSILDTFVLYRLWKQPLRH